MNQREFYELGVDGFIQALEPTTLDQLIAAFKEMVGPKDRSSLWELKSEISGDAAKIFNGKVDLLYSRLSEGDGLVSVSLLFPHDHGPNLMSVQQLADVLCRVYGRIIEDDKSRHGLVRTQEALLCLKL